MMDGFASGTQVADRASEVMAQGLGLVDLFVNKNYLIDVDRCDPVPLKESEKTFTVMSLLKIDKIVYDEKENINDKLISVYSALSNLGSTVIMILDSDKSGVGFYIGTRDADQPYVAGEILKKGLKGNFPGINITEEDASQIESLLEARIPTEYSSVAISSVSIVPGTRDDDKDKFVQGIEKFIDSMAGEDYTAVFISQPLGKEALESKKRGYEEMYTALSQVAEMSLTYGENVSDSIAIGVSDGFSKAVNDGISDTTGKNSGTNKSHGFSHNHGANLGLFGSGVNFGSEINTSHGSYSGTSESHTQNYSETETTTNSRTDTKTNTTGSNASIQISRKDKSVEELMEKIDEQLKRIKNCESYGLWDSACYFLSKEQEVSIVAANTYKALVAGEETSVENSFINIWDNDFENSARSLEIMEYLRYGIHPVFQYKPEFADPEYSDQEITAASMISGVEVPILMGLPHKSVNGVTSIVSAEFGRNVFTKSFVKPKKIIDLGAVYHMGEVFPNNRVRLNLESLTSHCFITGSTGSGKSNTTYKLLDELLEPRNNIKFMVIEPAKGEYKLNFGDLPGLHVYTTNPKYYSMLRINPFEFNEQIHVLEHLDRLIEIFSACWPLYAAMPAVLKSSFERAYIAHGWDLNHSRYVNMGNGKFPTFMDVVDILPVILNESAFSDETRGNYIGSLVTRVESLTNGLVGQVFNSVAISDEVLFDENTVVDLSRVGSTETKALIMGVLVLKLSEYRQSSSKGTNLPLQHVTIMEEAHNLLKRTSTDQGQESANVQGKSVEMISSSIAEMRTYGEGFIIVDQSPTAVDISAIKNTNTKIVMRLPEAEDCEAIGRSIGLDDSQIRELSRLDKGVAAVFQNDWLEAVLTKIDKASNSYENNTLQIQNEDDKRRLVGDLLQELVAQDEAKDFNLQWLKDLVNDSYMESGYKNGISRLLDNYKEDYDNGNKATALPKLMIDLTNCGDLIKMYDTLIPNQKITKVSQLTKEIRDAVDKWKKNIYKNLDSYACFDKDHVKDVLLLNIIFYQIYFGKHPDKYKYVLHCVRKQKA